MPLISIPIYDGMSTLSSGNQQGKKYSSIRILWCGAVVVAQLAERSLPTPVIWGLNPNIGKILCTNCTFKKKRWKQRNRGREWPIFKKRIISSNLLNSVALIDRTVNKASYEAFGISITCSNGIDLSLYGFTWSLNGRLANEVKFLTHLTAMKRSLAQISWLFS